MRFKNLALAVALTAVSAFAYAGSELVGRWTALSGAPGTIVFEANGSAIFAPEGVPAMRVKYKRVSKSLLEITPALSPVKPAVVVYDYRKGTPDILEFNYQNGQSQTFARQSQKKTTKK